MAKVKRKESQVSNGARDAIIEWMIVAVLNVSVIELAQRKIVKYLTGKNAREFRVIRKCLVAVNWNTM